MFVFAKFLCSKEFLLCFWHSLADNAVENTDTNIGNGTCHPESLRIVEEECKEESKDGISLPPFGLATYKLQGDVWIKPHTSDYERMIHLYSASESWLKQLGVHHHDFNFFTFHSTM